MRIKKIINWQSHRRLSWMPFFATSDSIRYQSYQIEYMRHHEIVCPRYTFADGTDVIVLPWYLIPGRPYPVQIYLYACELYCSNPTIGQRGAAKATREKFKLNTFSHSTVSRSFRSFERAQKQALENKFGEEATASGTESPKFISAASKSKTKNEEAAQPEKRFPATADTSTRRKSMGGFFPKYPDGAQRGEIESASIKFVGDWHEKNRRLLL